MTALSRRHVLAGAAATVAAAALPAAAVAEATSWSMQFVEDDAGFKLLSWQPNSVYRAGQIVSERGKLVMAAIDHMSGDVFRTRNWLLVDVNSAVA